MLVVVETYSGPEAVAFGACGVCGWSGWSSWDVGLERLGGGPHGRVHWAYDEDPQCECPVRPVIDA
jgi:hypothetical protein